MIHVLHYALHQVADYIHWLYFFHAWGFPAQYGSIARVHGCKACRQAWLDSFPADERNRATEAMQLYDDAQQLLREMDGRYQTHAIAGLFPACGDGEDIVLWTEGDEQHRLPLLRQQHADDNRPCLCLSDFVRPLSNGQRDQIGLFCATVDEALEESYPDDHYRHMLCQTLADRLAEATAERMHEEVRRHLWGYAPEEHLSVEDMLHEHYQGRRPAVGYPSLPDQSLNFLIDDILQMQQVGIRLTESGAMRPHASTSGLILAHPATRHFMVGQISDEQLQDYARRRGLTTDQARVFLAANLTTTHRTKQ